MNGQDAWPYFTCLSRKEQDYYDADYPENSSFYSSHILLCYPSAFFVFS